MRRTTAHITLLVLLIALLAGCGEATIPSASNPEAQATATVASTQGAASSAPTAAPTEVQAPSASTPTDAMPAVVEAEPTAKTAPADAALPSLIFFMAPG